MWGDFVPECFVCPKRSDFFPFPEGDSAEAEELGEGQMAGRQGLDMMMRVGMQLSWICRAIELPAKVLLSQCGIW